MTEEEFNIKTIRTQLDYLVSQMEKLPVQAPKEIEELPENVTLELAARYKGGCSFATYKTRAFLQPCGGTNSHRVGGRKCWKRKDVLEWLTIDDAALPEYLKRFGVAIKK